MTIKAKSLGKAGGTWQGVAHLYELSEPVSYGWEDEHSTTKFVVSSAVSEFAIEVYIFPANEKGEAIDWGEMEGSMKGAGVPDDAIRNAGWELVDEL